MNCIENHEHDVATLSNTIHNRYIFEENAIEDNKQTIMRIEEEKKDKIQ